MAEAATAADRIVVTDDNPRHEDPDGIVRDILAGFATDAAVTVCRDRRRAVVDAVRQGAPGDVVLVAGKGHETYQETNGVRTDFDDFKEVQSALNELEK